MSPAIGARMVVTAVGRRTLCQTPDARTDYTLRAAEPVKPGCAVVVTTVGPGLSVTATHRPEDCGSCGTRLHWERADREAAECRRLGIMDGVLRDVRASARPVRSDDEMRAIDRIYHEYWMAREAHYAHAAVSLDMPLPGGGYYVHMTDAGLMVGIAESRTSSYISDDEMGTRSVSWIEWRGDRPASQDEIDAYHARAQRITAEQQRRSAALLRAKAAYDEAVA